MLGQKKCMKCGTPATHKFTKIQGSQIYDIFLCAEHAAEMSPYQKTKSTFSDMLESILKESMAAASGAEAGGPDLARLRCGGCGLPYAAYRKTLMLGCPNCYASFRAQLLAELRKFHGENKHFGRRPSGDFKEPQGAAVLEPSDSTTKPIHEAADPAPPPKTPKPSFTLPGQQAAKSPKPAATKKKSQPSQQSIDELVTVEELRQRMKRAIQAEDFALAARCRDRIRLLGDAAAESGDAQ